MVEQVTILSGVHTVLPAHRYPQRELMGAFGDLCLGPQADRTGLERLFAHAGVNQRHLCLPLECYGSITDFGAANDLFLHHARQLGAQALSGALRRAGLAPDQLDVVFSTTVTGVAVPSLEVLIARDVGLRADVRRVPLFGLGCAGGAAGLARLHDYLVGHPRQVGALVSVELCSLTLRRSDRSAANLVAGALFGDGAAAVVATGTEHPAAAGGPRVLDSRSCLYPDTEAALGWHVGGEGLRIVLDAQVPSLLERHLGTDVRALLTPNGLRIEDVAAWVCHAGGPRVIEAVETVLALPGDPLELTWRSLGEVGNLSSASVLHVLRDTLDKRAPAAGSPGVVLAVGPGIGSELVLVRW